MDNDNRMPIRSLTMSVVENKTGLKPRGFGLVLLLDGQLTFTAENTGHTVSADDLFLISRTEQTQLCPVPDSRPRVIVLILDIVFVQKYLPDASLIPDVIPKSHPVSVLLRRHLIHLTAEYYGHDPHRFLKLVSGSMELLCAFTDSFLSGRQKSFCQSQPSASGTDERTSEIIRYIQDNYSRQVTLEELANHLNLSGAYLSRYITKHLRMGFQEYLCRIRMSHAVRDLTDTADSIITIALRNGFPNIASFNRSCREMYNVTPNQYRKLHTSSAPVDTSALIPEKYPERFLKLPELPKHGKTAQTILLQASPVPVDTLQAGWHDMINLGFGIHCGHIHFQKQLEQLLNKIHFRYGRIQGIFGNANNLYTTDISSYPLTELDTIFDFFQRIHLLPHIDFSVMRQFPQNQADIPKLALIQRFLKYYVKRYGLDTVRQWRFEYSFPLTVSGSPAMDLELYIENCCAIKNLLLELVPSASFGCFGTSPKMSWGFTEKMLKAAQAAGCVPDFWTLHLCPYEPPAKADDARVLSPSSHFFRDYVRRLRELAPAAPYSRVPFYVTSLEFHDKSYINDSAFMGPFIFKTWFDLYPYVKSMAYAGFTDFIYNDYGENPCFFGGNGIITRQGIRKPSYFALFMLAKSPNRILLRHENCMILTGDANTCQILLHNYVHYKKEYCINPAQNGPLTQINHYFEEGNTLHFILDFSLWPSGNYRIQKFRMGSNAGSALDEYLRLGIKDDMLPIELEYLMERTNLHIEVDYVTINETTTMEMTLAPLDMAVLVIYPI